jgi:hypothetical protein
MAALAMLKSNRNFVLTCALLGALAPFIIQGLGHFVPDPTKNYCGPGVAQADCAENVLALHSAEKFDLMTLPFWPTRPIIVFVGFMMMEEGRDGDLSVIIGVTGLAIFLNAASYAFVGLLVWRLKEIWNHSRKVLA